MDRKHDIREVQDMQNEMLAAQGEATYWEGKLFEIVDAISSGYFSADQLEQIKAEIKKQEESLAWLPYPAKPF